GAIREQVRLEEVVGEPAPEALRFPDVDDPSLTVDELVRAGSIRDRAGFGSGDHVSILAAIAARIGPRWTKAACSGTSRNVVWSEATQKATASTTATSSPSCSSS